MNKFKYDYGLDFAADSLKEMQNLLSYLKDEKKVNQAYIIENAIRIILQHNNMIRWYDLEFRNLEASND